MISASSLGRLRALVADAGVRATATTRLIALIGAPITLYLAATRIEPMAQGLYFVALNIVMIGQLFELGLGTIVVQFASHEWPRLRWGPGGGLEGDPAAREAVNVLMLSAIRWYRAAALLLVAIAGIGGGALYLHNRATSVLGFSVLWLGFVGITALYVTLIPFVCIAEGCGDLLSVQRMRSWQAAAVLIALWTGIVTSGVFVAAWLAATVQLIVAALWLLTRHRALVWAPRTLSTRLTDADGIRVRFRSEQKRSAQLWLALWLSPQLLAPALVKIRGGDEAGRLGVTLAMSIAPLTLALAALHGRYPSFGAMVSERRTHEFDALAWRATKEATLMFWGMAAAVSGIALVLPYALPAFALRVLPFYLLMALFVASFVGLLLQAMAGYLRAFRDERIAPSIVGGTTVVTIASITGAIAGGVQVMVIAHVFASVCVAFPLAYAHFARIRSGRLAV